MTVNRRTKNSRQRGTHTHGWGSKKKHRGAGSRGGRGMAGTGKRGDAKKPTIWGNTKYFGKYGFKKPTKVIKTVNLAYIDHKFDSLLAKGVLKKDGDSYAINLNDLKYTKLLGAGQVTRSYKITAKQATPSAIEKVKAKGGQVILPAAVAE